MDSPGNCLTDQKLIVTIVQKGMASKIVDITKEAGAQGGTILLGRGTGVREYKKLFGISLDPEKELILTLSEQHNATPILNAVVQQAKLDRPGKGISFVLDIPRAAGMVHLPPGGGAKKGEDLQMSVPEYDLILTIVDKGFGDQIVEISKEAGAEGGTIVYGRGTGIHEKIKLLGIPIEPEKELVLTLILRKKTNAVLDAILEQGELCKPGKGIAFVLNVDKTAGINHPVV